MSRVLIEGLDLVGKTTLCNNLINDYNDEFDYKSRYYTTENPLFWMAVNKTKEGYSADVIGWLYSAAAQYELEKILEDDIYKSDKIIIQDSFFLNRTIGFNENKDRILLLKLTKEIISKIEKPEKVIYLYADQKTKQERFFKRQSLKQAAVGDKQVFESSEDALRREELMKEFMTNTYNAELIDTSNINESDLKKMVYQKIKGDK